MSGVIKGIGKAVKKVVKGVGHFIKRYWKVIVIAAAIVFTAGIATVGVAGFSSAMAAGGGGFAGFMSAAGSTMVAGVASIGGTIGIGSGVTASTAGGAFAAAPVLAGVGEGAGLTLGTGAAAQGLGIAASTYAPAAAEVGGAAGGAAGGAGSFNALTGAGTYTGPGAVSADTSLSGALGGQVTAADVAGGAGAAGGAVGSSAISQVPDIAYSGTQIAPAASQSPGLLGTVLNSKAAVPLIYSGMQAIQGYAQGKAQQDEIDRTKPMGFFGVGVRGNAPDANVNSIFGTNEELTGGVVNPAGGLTASNSDPFSSVNAQGQPTQPVQQISPYVPDARANLPNGTQWMPNLPNAQQGLMTIGWNPQTGQPIYANDPNAAYQGG
jgi:hypothetical protein